MNTVPSVRTFSNPIQPVGADPYLVFHDGYYYIVGSGGGKGVFLTRSLKNNFTDFNDSYKKKQVWVPPVTGPASVQIWAPELHRVGEKWFIYYAGTTEDGDNANHRMFVIESEGSDPFGPYIDRGVLTDTNNRWAIDGHRFEYNGEAYFVWSGWEEEDDLMPAEVLEEDGTEGELPGKPQYLYIAKMDSPTSLVGAGVRISSPNYAWERRAMPINEGPQTLINNGQLHIVYSASGSWTDDYCYGVITAVGDDLLDPKSWHKHPELVFEKTHNVYGPGHGTFIKSPDGLEDWMVYHSARWSGGGWNRQINAQKFTWTEDGLPNFGKPHGSDVQQEVPSGQPDRRQRK